MVMTALIGMGVGAALSAGISAAQGGSVGDILKSAGIGGVTGAATAGVGSAVGGSAAGLIGSGLSKAGGAISGAANTGSLLSKIGTGLATAGSKMVDYGATHGVKAALSGNATGGAATSSTSTLAPVPGSAAKGYLGELPDLTKTAVKAPVQGTANVANATGAPILRPKAVIAPSQTSAATSAGAPVLRPKAVIAPSQTSAVTSATTSATASAKPNLLSKVGPGIKKAVGQVGVQGALSLISAGMAAKQARVANAAQEQSLLFQKQTYNEAKAKEESRKAQLKTDAWNAYESANQFGATLFGSDSNNTLLTNGTGNAGDYSILTVGLSSRKTDLT